MEASVRGFGGRAQSQLEKIFCQNLFYWVKTVPTDDSLLPLKSGTSAVG